MFRTVFFYIYLSIYLILTMPALIKANLYHRKKNYVKRDKIVNVQVRNFGKSMVKVSGSNVKVVGEENLPDDKAVVFVSNHQSNFDIPILLGYIEKSKGFIAKKELEKFPIMNKWMIHMKCVFIDRNNIREGLKAIKQGVEYLKMGYSTVLFPEGTRSKGEKLGEFKAGSLKLAVKSGVPIVPVTIKGSYKIMEANGSIIKPADVEIVISKPVETVNLTKEENNKLLQRLRDIISSKL